MGMIVGWGKTHPKCLYLIEHYILFYEQHSASYLPLPPPIPIEKWSLRFISVSSVSSSAFLSSSDGSLEGKIPNQSGKGSGANRYSRQVKSVTWIDDRKSSVPANSQPTPDAPVLDPFDPPNLPTPIMGSALKSSPSYDVITSHYSAPLKTSSAPYYPSSRGTHQTHILAASPGVHETTQEDIVPYDDAEEETEALRLGNEGDFMLGGTDDFDVGDYDFVCDDDTDEETGRGSGKDDGFM